MKISANIHVRTTLVIKYLFLAWFCQIMVGTTIDQLEIQKEFYKIRERIFNENQVVRWERIAYIFVLICKFIICILHISKDLNKLTCFPRELVVKHLAAYT